MAIENRIINSATLRESNLEYIKGSEYPFQFFILDSDNNIIFSRDLSTSLMEEIKVKYIDISRERKLTGDGDVFVYKNNYIYIKNLTERSGLSGKIVSIRSMAYLDYLWTFINIMLVISFLLFVVLYLFIADYTMKNIFSALREIGDYAKELNKKDNNFLKKYNKRYNNEEIDNLIVSLNSLIERGDRTLQYLADFTLNVSHELKSPIASMKGMIEIQLFQERTNEEYKETLEMLLEEASWMEKIVKNLLIISRDSKEAFRNFQDVRVTHLLSEVCEFMGFLAFDQGIDLQLDIDKDCEEMVECDIAGIKQVLVNILTNAIKYNRNGGWIKVTSSCLGDFVHITIADSGVGIKKENIERVSEKFFREDTVRTTKKSGAGLGLAIVKFILDGHSGELLVESVEGTGSTFTVVIPKKQEK